MDRQTRPVQRRNALARLQREIITDRPHHLRHMLLHTAKRRPHAPVTLPKHPSQRPTLPHRPEITLGIDRIPALKSPRYHLAPIGLRPSFLVHKIDLTRRQLPRRPRRQQRPRPIARPHHHSQTPRIRRPHPLQNFRSLRRRLHPLAQPQRLLQHIARRPPHHHRRRGICPHPPTHHRTQTHFTLHSPQQHQPRLFPTKPPGLQPADHHTVDSQISAYLRLLQRAHLHPNPLTHFPTHLHFTTQRVDIEAMLSPQNHTRRTTPIPNTPLQPDSAPIPSIQHVPHRLSRPPNHARPGLSRLNIR